MLKTIEQEKYVLDRMDGWMDEKCQYQHYRMDGWKVLGKVEMFEKPKSKKMEILGKTMDEMNLEI